MQACESRAVRIGLSSANGLNRRAANFAPARADFDRALAGGADVKVAIRASLHIKSQLSR